MRSKLLNPMVIMLVIGVVAGGYWLGRQARFGSMRPASITSSPTATPVPVVAKPALIPVPPDPGARDPQPQGKPIASSPTLLQACWTADQLRGVASDKEIKKQITNRSPPERRTFQATSLPTALSRSIRYVKPRNGEKLVALTFDLCEQANERSGYDADLVNYLRDHRVKATFFAGGKWMHSHPDKTMQLMADPLFEIGNHTWTHANLRVLKGPEMDDQITWTQAEYGVLREKLLGSKCAMALGDQAAATIPLAPTLFRFPYGACDSESLAAVNRDGLAAIQWNIVAGDPDKGQTARGIARAVLDQVRPGSIVIAHANGRGWHTAEALPLIIPELRARGYRFVTVSELLAQGETVAVDSCYELRPGDNLRYDQRFGASKK